MIRTVFALAACAIFAAQPVFASPKETCAAPPFRAFDYWVGEWTLIDGATDKPAGHTTVAPIEDGCALLETYASTSSGTGRSVTTYSPVTDRWSQHFVGLNITSDIEGGLDGRVMTMTGTITYLQRRKSLEFKGVWTPLSTGDVDQVFYERAGPAEAWHVWFHSIFRKRAS